MVGLWEREGLLMGRGQACEGGGQARYVPTQQSRGLMMANKAGPGKLLCRTVGVESLIPR